MKVRNIVMAIKDKHEVLHEFATLLAKARKGQRSGVREQISFQNVETLRKVLTVKRIELLHAIRRHNPDSIYQLAKLSNRDLKSVNTDLAVLTDLGLVLIEAKMEERKKAKPIVEFDRLRVDITI